MKNMNEIINDLHLEQTITLDDIPNIDLYMDQVIQLFESKFDVTKRTKEEKVLTKTMINNYAKGKVFFPIKNKKYSKDHLILLSMIYQLKGSLSINDIKTTLQGINDKIEKTELDLDALYDKYLNLFSRNVSSFKENVRSKAKEVTDEIHHLEANNIEELEQVLLIASLIHTSNMYRKVAEKLIDELA